MCSSSMRLAVLWPDIRRNMSPLNTHKRVHECQACLHETASHMQVACAPCKRTPRAKVLARANVALHARGVLLCKKSIVNGPA